MAKVVYMLDAHVAFVHNSESLISVPKEMTFYLNRVQECSSLLYLSILSFLTRVLSGRGHMFVSK